MAEERTARRVLMVVVAVTALAVCAFAAAFGETGRPSFNAVVLAPALGALAMLARMFPLQVAFRRRMVLDTAPMFTAVLLLPPALAAAAVLTGIAIAEAVTGIRRKDLDWRQVVFNASQAMLGVLCGALAFEAVAESQLPSDHPSVMWGALVAFCVMFLVNDLLVFSVVWAQLGLRFRTMVADFVRGRSDWPWDLALYAAGFIAALAGSIHAWLIAVLVAPLPALYRAMRDQVALREQTREAVIALADVVDARDAYTFGHCKRTAEFAEQICRELRLSPDETDEIVLGARLHDLGKVGIRDACLLKPGHLTEDEYAHIKTHPDIGAKLTGALLNFERGTTYIRHHHERFDGSGYPLGLKGKDIPLGARIVAVADTYDAMTSTRVYRNGLSEEVTRHEMARVAGTQLDPVVVAAWFRVKGWAWPDEYARHELAA